MDLVHIALQNLLRNAVAQNLLQTLEEWRAITLQCVHGQKTRYIVGERSKLKQKSIHCPCLYFRKLPNPFLPVELLKPGASPSFIGCTQCQDSSVVELPNFHLMFFQANMKPRIRTMWFPCQLSLSPEERLFSFLWDRLFSCDLPLKQFP